MAFHKHPAVFANYLHVKVKNLERSLSFYEKILGFIVIKRDQKMVQMSANGTHLLFTIEQLEKALPLDPRNTGLFHVAFLLPERKDLANVLRHLVQSGYPLQGASDHLVSEALYLADPDGNGIEIYSDRDPSTWNWNNREVDMATLPLQAENLLTEADQTGWKGMPPKTIIGHIHLQVSELEKVAQFYTKGLGFDIVSQFGRQALFLSTAGYHHHIGLNTWNSAGGSVPDDQQIGMKNYSLSVPAENRDKIAVRLRDLGFAVESDEGHYVAQDPSGNWVRF